MIVSLTETQYRAMDKTHIYSSLLKTIYSKSSLHVDIREEDETGAFSFGTLAHMYILEPERFKKETILQPEFLPLSKEMKEKYSANMDHYSKTKECREQKEAFEASVGDKTVYSQSESERLKGMLTAIKNANYDLYEEFLTGGHAEYTIVNDHFRIGEKFYPVKVRIDYIVNRDVVTIIDVKTTQCAAFYPFKNDVKKYGYDIQAAFYIDVVRQKFPGKTVDFIWLAVEKVPPYAPAWYRCSAETYEYGREKYTSVMDQALQVLRGGEKRGYKAAYEIVSL